MNQYMLIYQGGEPATEQQMTEEQLQHNMQQWELWMAQLDAKGQLVSGGAPLEYTGCNIDHDKVVTDIAGIEVNELVTGYSIIKADDLETAVEIAKTSPIFNYPQTSVQVRQIMAL